MNFYSLKKIILKCNNRIDFFQNDKACVSYRDFEIKIEQAYYEIYYQFIVKFIFY